MLKIVITNGYIKLLGRRRRWFTWFGVSVWFLSFSSRHFAVLLFSKREKERTSKSTHTECERSNRHGPETEQDPDERAFAEAKQPSR